MNKPEIKISSSQEDFPRYFVKELVNTISGIPGDKIINLAVSGGSTPEPIFRELASIGKTEIPWNRINIFWVDERCVPPDNPESNFGMTNISLLTKVNIPNENIHRVFGENEPFEEAFRYSLEIQKFVQPANGIPSFDIILLGMGNDGHTASIFPDNPGLFASSKLCETSVHPQSGQQRITITGQLINNASHVLFHVTGKSKAALVKSVINKETDFEKYPAGLVNPAFGKLFWILDKDAAALL